MQMEMGDQPLPGHGCSRKTHAHGRDQAVGKAGSSTSLQSLSKASSGKNKLKNKAATWEQKTGSL